MSDSDILLLLKLGGGFLLIVALAIPLCIYGMRLDDWFKERRRSRQPGFKIPPSKRPDNWINKRKWPPKSTSPLRSSAKETFEDAKACIRLAVLHLYGSSTQYELRRGLHNAQEAEQMLMQAVENAPSSPATACYQARFAVFLTELPERNQRTDIAVRAAE